MSMINETEPAGTHLFFVFPPHETFYHIVTVF